MKLVVSYLSDKYVAKEGHPDSRAPQFAGLPRPKIFCRKLRLSGG
jgi:hypothetical protein